MTAAWWVSSAQAAGPTDQLKVDRTCQQRSVWSPLWKIEFWAWGEPGRQLPAQVHRSDLLPLMPQLFADREPRFAIGVML